MYLSAVFSELQQIRNHLQEKADNEKYIFLEFLEDNLFYLSLFVFVGMLFLLLFLRTIQQNNVKMKHLSTLPVLRLVRFGLSSLLKTMVFQAIVLVMVVYFHALNPIDEWKVRLTCDLSCCE